MNPEFHIECALDGDTFVMFGGPTPDSWLAWEIDALGDDWTIRRALNESEAGTEMSWEVAMRNGICPGQEFTVRFFSFTVYKSYYGEVDTEFEAEIVSAEPMTMAEHLSAWLKLFAEFGEPLVVPHLAEHDRSGR